MEQANFAFMDVPRVDHITLLERAADLIERYGFVQKNMGNKASGFCVEGAINYVARTSDPKRWVTCAARDAYFAFSHFVHTLRPAVWNDEYGRTKDEAIAALRACAAVERARGTLPEQIDTSPEGLRFWYEERAKAKVKLLAASWAELGPVEQCALVQAMPMAPQKWIVPAGALRKTVQLEGAAA